MLKQGGKLVFDLVRTWESTLIDSGSRIFPHVKYSNLFDIGLINAYDAIRRCQILISITKIMPIAAKQ